MNDVAPAPTQPLAPGQLAFDGGLRGHQRAAHGVVGLGTGRETFLDEAFHRGFAAAGQGLRKA